MIRNIFLAGTRIAGIVASVLPVLSAVSQDPEVSRATLIDTWYVEMEQDLRGQYAMHPAPFLDTALDAASNWRAAASASSIPVERLERVLSETRERAAQLGKDTADNAGWWRQELAWLSFCVDAAFMQPTPDDAEIALADWQRKAGVDVARRLAVGAFPEMAAEILAAAGDEFEATLNRNAGMELWPFLRYPMAPETHEALLAGWEGAFAAQISSALDQFGVYPLNTEVAPAGEVEALRRRKVDMVLSCMIGYVAARRQAYDPVDERLRDRLEAFKAMRFDDAETADLAVEYSQMRSVRRAWAQRVEEFEVLRALFDVAFQGPGIPFQFSRDGKEVHVPKQQDHPLEGVQHFSVQYARHSENTGEFDASGHLAGLAVHAGKGVRSEVVSRTPAGRASGVYYEPIGFTIDRTGPGLETYFIGAGGQGVASIRPGASVSAMEDSPMASPRDYQPAIEGQDRYSLSRPDRILTPGGRSGDEVTVYWIPGTAWIYNAPVQFGTYRFADGSEGSIVASASFRERQGGPPIAEVVWREPVPLRSGGVGYRQIEMRVLQAALLEPERDSDQPRYPVAMERVITWDYDVASDGDGASACLLRSVTVRDARGNTVLEMTLDPLSDYGHELPASIESPLAWASAPDAREHAYYVMLKDYHQARNAGGGRLAPDAVAEFVARAEQFLAGAEEPGAAGHERAAQHLLLDWYAQQGAQEAWFALARQHIASLGTHDEWAQLRFCTTSLIQRAIRDGRPRDSAALMEAYRARLGERLDVLTLFKQAIGLSAGGDYPQSVACLEAAREKLKPGAFYDEIASMLSALRGEWKAALESDGKTGADWDALVYGTSGTS